MCYHHNGDGICESFERTYSIQDCGFYTPEDYEDQWASDVTVTTRLQSDDCPAFAILGPPAVYHVSFRTKNSSFGTLLNHQWAHTSSFHGHLSSELLFSP